MIFYLGAHHPSWLGTLDVPLFVSRRSLAKRRSLPRARGAWALDSGGFTELSLRGGWELPARAYAAEVRRYRDEIGGMTFAAPQDWMCEETVLKKTGLTVTEHQRRTIANFLELRAIAPDLPVIPVLQGSARYQYLDCIDLYAEAGVDLWKEPLVGVGTICRRQNSLYMTSLLRELGADGLRLHAFGFKKTGLRACANALTSADSLAWSANARKHPPIPGHPHKSCSNCPEWALEWRDELLASLPVAA